MILTRSEVYALTLLAAMMLGGFLVGIGIFEEIAAGCRWLYGRLLRSLGVVSPSASYLVPARPVWTSARRMPQRVESAAAAGGSAGPERAWSVPSGPAAVPLLPLDYTPDGWTRDARGLHPPVPRAPRHAGTEPRIGGVTERTVPRKRTDGRPPWETDHFAVVRPDAYVPPVYGQAPVARVLEAEAMRP